MVLNYNLKYKKITFKKLKMEVKPDEGINIGKNPFYQPTNSSYGSAWQASAGEHPVKMSDIPLYSDVVSI